MTHKQMTDTLVKLVAHLGHEIPPEDLEKVKMSAQTILTLMDAREPDHPDDERQYVEVHWVWPDGRAGVDTVSVEVDPSSYRMAIDAVDLAICGNTPSPDATRYTVVIDRGMTRVRVTVDLKAD